MKALERMRRGVGGMSLDDVTEVPDLCQLDKRSKESVERLVQFVDEGSSGLRVRPKVAVLPVENVESPVFAPGFDARDEVERDRIVRPHRPDAHSDRASLTAEGERKVTVAGGVGPFAIGT